MPRISSHTKESLTRSAMAQFWKHGYEASSMDDLVKSTGVSRHGIYADFKGKHGLFIAVLKYYKTAIVTPAFAQVEASSATLSSVQAYFEQQIKLADLTGFPTDGCLIANTMTELAPHEGEVLELVQAHSERLRVGFFNALSNEAALRNITIATREKNDIAQTMVIFTHGLWSMSRSVDNARPLRRSVKTFLQALAKGHFT